MKNCKHATCSGPCRREKKPKRVLLTPLPKLLKKAQEVFNRYIRLRDDKKACISCSSNKANQAGHYISVRMSSYLRFDERNAALQCAWCNCYNYGSPITYRIELRKRIGDLELERLESDYIENKAHKWTRPELDEIIEKYTQKIKALKELPD